MLTVPFKYTYSNISSEVILYVNNNNEEELEDSIPFAENIIGFEFINCSSLPLINIPIEIEVGTRFYSISIAVHFVKQYALQKNFAVYKHKYKIFLNDTCKKRVFKCDLGGRYQEKLSKPVLSKVKNKESKKLEYMWQININQKRDSPIVTVILFNKEYNYKIFVEILKFVNAYKNFSKEIIEQIEFYVVHGRCNAITIRNLLQLKYPDHIFLTQDLENAIQRIKRKKGLNLGDVASLLIKLLEFQASDPA